MQSPMHHQQEQSLESTADMGLPSKENEIIITCKLCHQYLCCAVETSCNHIFCQSCIGEYLLFINECPLCKIPIRHKTFFSNRLLDNFVLDYIRICDSAALQNFNCRLQKYYVFKRSTTIQRSKLLQGVQVDILDKNYIWCAGRITKVRRNDDDLQIEMVIVRNEYTRERQQIHFPTTRLAVRGSYTNRKDIPHYHRRKVVFQDNNTLIELEDWIRNSQSSSNTSITRN